MKSKRFRLWLGYGIAVASVLFVARHLGLNLDQFVLAVTQVDAWRTAVAAAFFLVMLAMNAAAFAVLANAAGIAVSSRASSGAWLASLLAKYIPIGVGHVAGRGVLLAMRGATWNSLIATGIVEQVTSTLWCLLIALSLYAGVVYQSIVVVPVSAAVLCLLIQFGGRRLGMHWRSVPLFAALLLYFGAMIPYAAGYLVLVSPSVSPDFLAALFAGTVAGVATFVAPGGLGVREAAAAALTSGSSATLLAGLLVARVVILATEIAGSFVGTWMFRTPGARPDGGSATGAS